MINRNLKTRKKVRCPRKVLLCFIHFVLLLLMSYQTHSDDTLQVRSDVDLSDRRTRTLKGGWYLLDPYQYEEGMGVNSILTGLDVQLQKLILQHAGFDVDIQPVSWKQHQEDLETGKRDIALGAFYSPQRAKKFYMTEPYRFEENSVFVLRNDYSKQNYHKVADFLAYIKKNKLKIGVVDGYRYANEDINKFIEHQENQRFIVKSFNDNQNLNMLLQKKINAFLADRIVGATIIWRKKAGKIIAEKRIEDAKAPIYMLLSRQSISESDYKTINQAVKDIKKSPEYAKTVSWYLYPVMLLETTDSTWFYIIEMIGTIAFAISGLVVAYRTQASFMGTLLLALMPSFGGGLMRDIILGRFPVWFLTARHYIFVVALVVIMAFLLMKFFHVIYPIYRKLMPKEPFFSTAKILDGMLAVTDAIGLAAFTVTGVVVCMVTKTDPLWLWGPFFAFLTGAGGGILRDILVKGHTISAINGALYGEIAVLWGAFLSAYLFLSVNDVDPLNLLLLLQLLCVS